MDIFIKSFNRPYYLERCIRSVMQHVHGVYSITLLDDGTREVYLDKVKSMFPFVRIVRSPLADVKSRAIEAHIMQNQKYAVDSIPSNFWRESIRIGSEFFLLLEEDSWFTGHVDLKEVREIFTNPEVVTIKLSWSGNPGIVRGRRASLSTSFEEVKPSLPIASPTLAIPFLRDVAKVRSILTRAGLLNARILTPYYALYTVCSAFFKRDYWVYLWDGASDKIQETRQLEHAVKWRRIRPNSLYGKSNEELIKTSFITSSVPTRHHPSFDMIRLNGHLSELWLKGELDISQNQPEDFSIDYLSNLLDRTNDPACTSTAWCEWIKSFKKDHQTIGTQVEPKII